MSEPASIVIIEDDADINEVVAVHLRRNGFACTQAFSGSEGRLLLSGSEPFDLVITDLMPVSYTHLERDGGVAGEQRLDGSGAQLAFGGFGFDEQLVHYRRPP